MVARSGTVLLLLGILSAAFFLRLGRTEIGLPYLHHEDEIHIAGRAVEILKTGDWNPRWFYYGSLPIYLHTGVDAIHYAQLQNLPADHPDRIDSLDEIATPFTEASQRVLSPASFLRWNRALTALVGVLAVALTYFLGKELAGRPAGLLAAALLAVHPLHVEHSAYVTTDVPVGFLALASVLAAVCFFRRGHSHSLYLSLIFCGFAAATKYNSGIVWIAPLLALYWRHREDPGSIRPFWWISALTLPPLAFVVAMPYALLDMPNFLRSLGVVAEHYGVRGHGPLHTVESGLPHALVQARFYFENWGVLLVLAVLGAVLLLRNRRGWVTFSFPLLLVGLTVKTVVDFHRNLLPTYPFVAVAVATGSVMLLGALARRVKRPAQVTAVCAVVVLLAIRFTTSASEARAATNIETRSVAVGEINRLAKEHRWRRVAIAMELRFHPLDLDRLEIPHRLVRIEEVHLLKAPLDAIVTAAEFATTPQAPDELRETVQELNRATEGLAMIALIPGAKVDPARTTRHPGVKIVFGGRRRQ